LHWRKLAAAPPEDVKPLSTYPTICWGLLIDKVVLPLTEICACTYVVVRVELGKMLPIRLVALARMFVKRNVRAAVPGGSMGTPDQVSAFC
jgi:hypothetical protein